MGSAYITNVTKQLPTMAIPRLGKLSTMPIEKGRQTIRLKRYWTNRCRQGESKTKNLCFLENTNWGSNHCREINYNWNVFSLAITDKYTNRNKHRGYTLTSLRKMQLLTVSNDRIGVNVCQKHNISRFITANVCHSHHRMDDHSTRHAAVNDFDVCEWNSRKQFVWCDWDRS